MVHSDRDAEEQECHRDDGIVPQHPRHGGEQEETNQQQHPVGPSSVTRYRRATLVKRPTYGWALVFVSAVDGVGASPFCAASAGASARCERIALSALRSSAEA